MAEKPLKGIAEILREQLLLRRTPPCPHDIFQLARRDPMVAACLREWEMGNMTYEQMLINLVVAQSAELEKYREISLRMNTSVLPTNALVS